jgi:hypothetical protein
MYLISKGHKNDKRWKGKKKKEKKKENNRIYTVNITNPRRHTS